MTIRFLQVVLLAAALFSASWAYAQEKPVPAKSPPRVPFTAFRTKPILDLKTDTAKGQGSSLVVQDVPETKKKKTPAKTIAIREADSPAPLVKIRPIVKPVLDASEASRPPKGAEEDIIFSPRLDAPLVAASQPLRIIRGGIPVPPRKPGLMVTKDSGAFNVIERVLAEPADIGPVPATPQSPRPPTDAVQATPAQEREIQTQEAESVLRTPPSKPVVTSVRIRDNNRFSAHSRMAGASGGFSSSSGGKSVTRSIRSLGLPDDMQDLNIGPLRQGKGVSPVLMPGQQVTMAAPDDKRVDNRGIPNEVIVFFQENSSELEVGQIDVVNNDAVKMLKERPELELEIIGFSEPQKGGAETTKKMALSRALMIQRHLTRAGISADRLTVGAKGDNTPIEPRDRVEMYFDR